MRNAGSNVLVLNTIRLWVAFCPVTNLRASLSVCANFQVFARIPHPALRATLPPGEGIATFGGPATPGGVALRDEMQKN